MLIAVLSDIHANLAALDAVLSDLRDGVPGEPTYGGRRVDELWIIGDLVGYGPSAAGCIRRVMAVEEQVGVQMLAGNHERMLFARGEEAGAQPEALAAVYLQRLDLEGSKEMHWLEEHVSRPVAQLENDLGDKLVYGPDGSEREPIWQVDRQYGRYGCTFAHGSLAPRGGYVWPSCQLGTDPGEGARNRWAVQHSLLMLRQRHGATPPLCLFIGHSHSASFWHVDRDGSSEEAEETPIQPGDRTRLPDGEVLVNVGSVGAARGDEGYGHYVVFDSEEGTIQLRSARYQWQSTYSHLVQWWQERYRKLDWNQPWLAGESPASVRRRLIDKVCLGR